MRKLIILLIILIIGLPILGFGNQRFYANLVQIARSTIGQTRVPKVEGKTFNNDCIGYVKYIFYLAGLDLDKAEYRIFDNGVANLYSGLEARGLLYNAKLPALGDIVFFDNTYDINDNDVWDDKNTHIGIVTGITNHNTILYTHFVSGQVKEYRLNLYYPNTHAFKQKNGALFEINSYLRRNRNEGYARKAYISSFYFSCFAHIPFREQ